MLELDLALVELVAVILQSQNFFYSYLELLKNLFGLLSFGYIFQLCLSMISQSKYVGICSYPQEIAKLNGLRLTVINFGQTK